MDPALFFSLAALAGLIIAVAHEDDRVDPRTVAIILALMVDCFILGMLTFRTLSVGGQISN